MDKALLKKIAIGAGVVAFFLLLSYGFMPRLLRGEIVAQSDISGYIGMSHEMSQWNNAHPDDPTRWTDSMFGGMPTTAISLQNSGDLTQWIYNLLLTGKRPATYLFVALAGAFLLMLSLGVSWPLAVAGAIAIAFCSYNFQIIQVGHNTKMQAIAFMPWVLAALVFTYKSAIYGGKPKRRWLPYTVLGASLFALAVSLQVKANHQQITYYLGIIILLYAAVVLVDTILRHKDRLGRFFAASALLLAIGGLGIVSNANKLVPLYDYTQYTMRGGTELTQDGGSSSSKGLDIEYATAWSYGWNELPNLMIPNYNGGASSAQINPERSETVALLKQYGQSDARSVARNFPAYWGPQPFTAGPMYIGAVTIFLFLLGLILYSGKEKWWAVIASVLAVLMAVGNHFMPFTKFCFDYLPFYSKFRSVSMALVILQVVMPVLAILVLDSIARGNYEKKQVRRAATISFALTGGFCLLMWIFPNLAGNFVSSSDSGQPEVLISALKADRISLFRADCLKSFFIIILSFAAIIWSFTTNNPGKNTENRKSFSRPIIAAGVISAILFINLFAVGKRYLNSSHFTTEKNFKKVFTEREVDKLIKADPDEDYRVLDLTVNVFNSSVPSYHHKNIGGYSPAKLQRYQDLIDYYLTREINSIYSSLQSAGTLGELMSNLPQTPILDALNLRYIIIGADYPPLYNDTALGNAWFVNEIVSAATPDEEIALTGQVDLSKFAVVRDIPSEIPRPSENENDSIALSSYAPNELHYHYFAASDRPAVFSEIWYPDWVATVDGTPLPLFCADWTLRGAVLPAGEHELVMRFEPQSYKKGAAAATAASSALLLVLLLSLVGVVKKAKVPTP